VAALAFEHSYPGDLLSESDSLAVDIGT
jgi:hypothetical protein